MPITYVITQSMLLVFANLCHYSVSSNHDFMCHNYDSRFRYRLFLESSHKHQWHSDNCSFTFDAFRVVDMNSDFAQY